MFRNIVKDNYTGKEVLPDACCDYPRDRRLYCIGLMLIVMNLAVHL